MGSYHSIEDFVSKHKEELSYVCKGEKFKYGKEYLFFFGLPTGYGNMLVKGYLEHVSYGVALKIVAPRAVTKRWSKVLASHSEKAPETLHHPLPVPHKWQKKLQPCFLSTSGAYNLEKEFMGEISDWSQQFEKSSFSDCHTHTWYSSGNSLQIEEPGMMIGRRRRLMNFTVEHGLQAVPMSVDEEHEKYMKKQKAEEKERREKYEEKRKKRESDKAWEIYKRDNSTYSELWKRRSPNQKKMSPINVNLRDGAKATKISPTPPPNSPKDADYVTV